MPTTFSDLRSRVRTIMQRQDLSDADVGKYVNWARHMIQEELTLWYQNKSDTFTVSQGVKGYAIPTDWRGPTVFWYLQADGTRVTLEWINRAAHVIRFPDDTKQKPPTAVHVDGGLLQLDPTPDGTVTSMNRSYKSYLADLVLDTDTDRIVADFEPGLVFKSCQICSIQIGTWANHDKYRDLYSERRKAFWDVHVEHEESADVVNLVAPGIDLTRR